MRLLSSTFLYHASVSRTSKVQVFVASRTDFGLEDIARTDP